ncbi:NAD(P)H-dependent oxidoreductase [Bifidobacterium crudilactis]|jgi:NAD(P)H dehydrogenase (quinone)|uniref:NAD(P)H-dependent oxidoreductase n=1 Tax=Bifidobacterium crudilactis TaxID=327277 RepID=UPI002F352758
MSRVTIIYCHPYTKSFNHAVLESVVANMKAGSTAFDLLDLHADGFQPYYDAEELRLYHSGGTHDPLVSRYLDALQHSDGLIVITPIWWNGVPGMLKGFVDKVMKEGEGLTHTVSSTGIHGCLKNLKHAYVLTTSTSPTWYFRLMLGNGIRRIFINKTLKQIGVKRGTWVNLGGISNSSTQKRLRHLDRIRSMRFTF